MSGLDPEHRRHVLEAVAVWLDGLGEVEPPLPGVAPEAVQSTAPVPDLFSVLGQLTALTRETQLQGRATNRLHAELSLYPLNQRNKALQKHSGLAVLRPHPDRTLPGAGHLLLNQ